jgi:tetratricopeptide (TPR) repeat protein
LSGNEARYKKSHISSNRGATSRSNLQKHVKSSFQQIDADKQFSKLSGKNDKHIIAAFKQFCGTLDKWVPQEAKPQIKSCMNRLLDELTSIQKSTSVISKRKSKTISNILHEVLNIVANIALAAAAGPFTPIAIACTIIGIVYPRLYKIFQKLLRPYHVKDWLKSILARLRLSGRTGKISDANTYIKAAKTGARLYRNEKWDEALKSFNVALSKKGLTHDSVLWTYKGLAQSKSQDYNGAIKSYERAIDLDFNNAIAWLEISDACLLNADKGNNPTYHRVLAVKYSEGFRTMEPNKNDLIRSLNIEMRACRSLGEDKRVKQLSRQIKQLQQNSMKETATARIRGTNVKK